MEDAYRKVEDIVKRVIEIRGMSAIIAWKMSAVNINHNRWQAKKGGKGEVI